MTERGDMKGSARNAEIGPISQQEMALAYIEEHKISEILTAVIVGLMIERPDDHLAYINECLTKVKEQGAENLSPDTFVQHLHPLNDPVRLEMVHDEMYHRLQRKMEQKGEENEQQDEPVEVESEQPTITLERKNRQDQNHPVSQLRIYRWLLRQ